MDKRKILNLVIEEVALRLDALSKSALDAKDAATNTESKAENKYDTRGLEASYLAGAQAERTEKMKETLFHLQKIKDEDLKINNQISLLSLVTLVDENNIEKHLFILPVQGGIRVKSEGLEVQTITLSSPIGSLMLGKKIEDEIIFKQGKSESFFEVKVIS